jgi:hypothetical protein
VEFNLTWAAEICGVPRSKIAKAARSGRLPHAHKHPSGGFAESWIVSLEDLEGAGFKPDPAKVQQARRHKQEFAKPSPPDGAGVE